MKFLKIETIEEGQRPPLARIALIRVVDTFIQDCPISYAIVLRLPFQRWKTYFSSHNLENDQGWCVYTCFLTYHKWRREFKRGGMWVPIETDDL
jgi:hypothetical protein